MSTSSNYFETSRLRLRCLEPEDLPLLFTIESDPQCWEVGANRAPYSRYALKQYIARQPQDIFQCGELRFVVEERATGKPIGLVDLTSFSPVDARAEVGLAILGERRGQGWGSEALATLERYAAEVLHVRLLYGQAFARGSEASCRLFCSAGYRQLAVLPAWQLRRGVYEDVALFAKYLAPTTGAEAGR